MKRTTNALDDFVSLFLCNAWRLTQDHGELSLMNLELDEMLCLEEDSMVIVFLMLHGGLSAYVDARVEDMRFQNSNPKMDMSIWRLVLEFSWHVLV